MLRRTISQPVGRGVHRPVIAWPSRWTSRPRQRVSPLEPGSRLPSRSWHVHGCSNSSFPSAPSEDQAVDTARILSTSRWSKREHPCQVAGTLARARGRAEKVALGAGDVRPRRSLRPRWPQRGAQCPRRGHCSVERPVDRLETGGAQSVVDAPERVRSDERSTTLHRVDRRAQNVRAAVLDASPSDGVAGMRTPRHEDYGTRRAGDGADDGVSHGLPADLRVSARPPEFGTVSAVFKRSTPRSAHRSKDVWPDAIVAT